MFVNHLSEEELAKVFAHFIYRDDSIVEYYHCKNVIMDQEVYAAVLGAILSNLRRIARNHKVLILTEGEAISAVKKMYPTRAMEFFKYEKTFASYSTISQVVIGMRLFFWKCNHPRIRRHISLTALLERDVCFIGTSMIRLCVASTRTFIIESIHLSVCIFFPNNCKNFPLIETREGSCEYVLSDAYDTGKIFSPNIFLLAVQSECKPVRFFGKHRVYRHLRKDRSLEIGNEIFSNMTNAVIYKMLQ